MMDFREMWSHDTEIHQVTTKKHGAKLLQMQIGHNVVYVAIYKNVKELVASTSSFTR